MSHVIFLLKSDVDDGLRNWLSDSVQEFCLSDDDFKFWGKVYSVKGDIIDSVNFLL